MLEYPANPKYPIFCAECGKLLIWPNGYVQLAAKDHKCSQDAIGYWLELKTRDVVEYKGAESK